MHRLKLTRWNRIRTVEALLRLLRDTHRVHIGWEKGRFSGVFLVSVEGEDEEACVRRLRDFCADTQWVIEDA